MQFRGASRPPTRKSGRTMTSIRRTLSCVLVLLICDPLSPSQAEGPPVFEVDSCDNVMEFWKELCMQGKCTPRTDGGCRKPAASGVCTTRGGCMQGDLKAAQSLAPSPVRPERMGPYDVADPEVPEPRYVNLITPANGDTFRIGDEVEVRFHIEVMMLKQSFDELLASVVESKTGDELPSVMLPSLGFGAYAVIQVDGEEHAVLGRDGPVPGTVLERIEEAFPGPDAPAGSVHTAVFAVAARVEVAAAGPHTVSVEVREGVQGAPPPCHAWIMMEDRGGGGGGVAGVAELMGRVLELEEELAYLRALADRHAAKATAQAALRQRAPKHLVMELGANDGSWIRHFCEKNPHFEPHIFEPQPRFLEALSAIAAKYKGRHNAKAAWTERGKRLTFHAHQDEGGVGSSLFDQHAYGKCGSRVCDQDFSETYEVETEDFVAYLREVALPHDFIVLRMDIEGAEYEVARRMVTEGVACWIDFWEFEGHALYSPNTAKYRPVDAVLPWLLQDCGVQMIVQDWYTEDWKVYTAWNESDPCKQCPLPVISDLP